MKRSVLFLGAAVLAISLAAQFWTGCPPGPRKGIHLAGALPNELTGWSGREVPLGATESMQKAVAGTLQYDDAYFREFTSIKGSVSLYVSYWEPGKMPTHLVASHTPDRCWTAAGWICNSMRHHVAITGKEITLRPGEWREFSQLGAPALKVTFWHVVGDGLYDYGERFNQLPSAWRWGRDALVQMFRSPPQQYFIRLSSSRSFEELRDDPGWNELLRSLGKIGLIAPAS